MRSGRYAWSASRTRLRPPASATAAATAALPRTRGASASTARKPSGKYATTFAARSNPVMKRGSGAVRNSSGESPWSRQPENG
jgi:hypothetical protein